MTLTFTLIVAAVSIGAVHSLAPDHWVPFAALARAEQWSGRRTAAVTAACGLGHVTVSVALGLFALLFGVELLQTFGQRLESVAGLLLIGFGVAYLIWGIRRAVEAKVHHGHAHARLKPRAPFDAARGLGDGARGLSRTPTAWTLFLLFCADPCVAVIPIMFAAAPLGWFSTLTVVAAYELATIATMIALVLPARAAARTVRGVWADQWGDALAGAVVATVGIAVTVLGI